MSISCLNSHKVMSNWHRRWAQCTYWSGHMVLWSCPPCHPLSMHIYSNCLTYSNHILGNNRLWGGKGFSVGCLHSQGDIPKENFNANHLFPLILCHLKLTNIVRRNENLYIASNRHLQFKADSPNAFHHFSDRYFPSPNPRTERNLSGSFCTLEPRRNKIGIPSP